MDSTTYDRAAELQRNMQFLGEYINELIEDNANGSSSRLAPSRLKNRGGYDNDIRDIISEATTLLVARYRELLAKQEAEFAAL